MKKYLLLVLFIAGICKVANAGNVPVSPQAATGAAQPAAAPSLVPARENFVTMHDDHPTKSIADDRYTISLYEPTYILPFYYTASGTPTYINTVPDNQSLKKTEFNFQFSLKTPIARNFWGGKNGVYMAYTQRSFWQAYQHSPFFRTSNYQPEIFVTDEVDFPLWNGWRAQFVNAGAMHESNGFGGPNERSWNRLYVDTTLTKNNWLVNVRPWYVIHDNSMRSLNPDITDYLGHGRLVVAYKFHEQSFAVQTYNLENGFDRTSVELSWSAPLTKKVRVYVKWFSGYGQSLLEYNKHTNSVGVGISLSDWV